MSASRSAGLSSDSGDLPSDRADGRCQRSLLLDTCGERAGERDSPAGDSWIRPVPSRPSMTPSTTAGGSERGQCGHEVLAVGGALGR